MYTNPFNGKVNNQFVIIKIVYLTSDKRGHNRTDRQLIYLPFARVLFISKHSFNVKNCKVNKQLR